MKKWMVVALAVSALALLACGGGTSSGDGGGLYGGQEPGTAATEPAPTQAATEPPGTTVTWTNEDNVPHTVMSGTRDNPSDLFDSGNVEPGEVFTYTFDEAGTYDYFCSIHPGMNGTVIVEP
jgi:plastocyanin